MTISDGESVNAAVTNSSFVSKEDDTSNNEVTGIINLNNTSVPASGAQIPNLQETLNETTTKANDNEADISDIRTTTGTADGDTDMGSYTAGPVAGFNLTANQDTKTNVQELLDGVDARILLSEKGAANGVATLDGSGKIPSSELPTELSSYLGAWAASTNTPTLTNGTGDTGDFYRASDTGSVDFGAGSISFVAGDAVIYNGTIWEKIPATDLVTSVAGRQGDVVITAADLADFDTEVSNNTDVVANTAKVSADGSIDTHSDVDTTTTPPTLDQALIWDGSNFVPGDVASGGGGSGLKNFIDFESSTLDSGVIGDTAWVSYDDGAAAEPVDGTGGSPSTLTLSVPTSGLDGNTLQVAKSAADGQGEGISVDSETIGEAFRGKIAYGEFLYDASDANYADDDIGVYLYDVTNSALVSILEADNGLKNDSDKFTFSYIIPDTCAQIRLILHVQSTNASAYDVLLDNIKLSPETLSVDIGNSYTETIDLTGSGDFTGGEIYVSRSNNIVSIHSTALLTFASTSFAQSAVGLLPTWARPTAPAQNDYNSGSVDIQVEAESDGRLGIRCFNPSGSPVNRVNAGNFFTITYPVEEIGTSLTATARNSQLAFAHFSNTSFSTPNAVFTTLGNYTEVESRNFSGMNLTTGVWTVPRTATYEMYAKFGNTGNGGVQVLDLKVNGTVEAQNLITPTSSESGAPQFNLTKHLQKGDLVRVDMFQNGGGATTTSTTAEDNTFQIREVPFTQTAIVQQNKVAVLREVLTAGTNAGTNVVGTQDRVLNNLDDPFGIIGSLSSIFFTFSSPGKYFIYASAPGFLVSEHRITLTTSANVNIETGSSEFSGTTTQSRSVLSANLTITDTSTQYKIRHYTAVVRPNNGLGATTGDGLADVYTEVYIMKVGE